MLRDALEMLLWCEDIARTSAQEEVDAYFDAQEHPGRVGGRNL